MNDLSLSIGFLRLFLAVILFLSLVFSFDAMSEEVLRVEQGEKLLKALKVEKERFLIQVSREEDECLKLFLSGQCLESLIIKYENKIREMELKKQNIIRMVRRYESNIRKEKRKRNLESLNRKTN